MSSWIPIDTIKHAQSKWQLRQGYQFAASIPVAAVQVAELSHLLPHYALGFVEVNSSYQLVAILGLGGEHNFYVNQEGNWLCPYVPASLRGYPFVLANAEKEDESVFCIAEDALDTKSANQPLFDEEGKITGLAADTLDFLRQCDQSRKVTLEACKALKNADVIEPWPINVEVDGGLIPIEGFFRINEESIRELEAETLGKLRNNGALSIVFGQLFSTNQFARLGKLADYVGSEKEKADVMRESIGLADTNSGLNFDNI